MLILVIIFISDSSGDGVQCLSVDATGKKLPKEKGAIEVIVLEDEDEVEPRKGKKAPPFAPLPPMKKTRLKTLQLISLRDLVF